MHKITGEMRIFEVWNANNPDEANKWRSLWQAMSASEVFAHPEYVRLFANEHSQAMCASLKSPDGIVLYPFLLRDLTIEPYWQPNLLSATDTITPYGYGGPFVSVNGDLEELASYFWANYDRWAKEENVVSEFIRFPLFDTLPYPGLKMLDRQNIVRFLIDDPDAMWMDFKHKVRKNINRARKNNIIIEIDRGGSRLSDFLRIYSSTMERREANEGYFFSQRFFEHIIEKLPGQYVFFHAIHQGRVVSTELVLISAHNIYSFLGGTDSEAFHLRPNDLLKFEIIQWAKDHGKQRFVLGGGYYPEDGIFRYKEAFAPPWTNAVLHWAPNPKH